MEKQRRYWLVRAVVVGGLGALVALAALSVPSEPTPAKTAIASESETAPRWSGDPSIAGLSVGPDAQPGDIVDMTTEGAAP